MMGRPAILGGNVWHSPDHLFRTEQPRLPPELSAIASGLVAMGQSERGAP